MQTGIVHGFEVDVNAISKHSAPRSISRLKETKPNSQSLNEKKRRSSFDSKWVISQLVHQHVRCSVLEAVEGSLNQPCIQTQPWVIRFKAAFPFAFFSSTIHPASAHRNSKDCFHEQKYLGNLSISTPWRMEEQRLRMASRQEILEFYPQIRPSNSGVIHQGCEPRIPVTAWRRRFTRRWQRLQSVFKSHQLLEIGDIPSSMRTYH